MIRKVEEWFKDRNMQDADPQKQMLKLMEEVGELSAAITRNDEIETIDALGDIQVVLIGLALQLNLNLNDCLDHAYSEIKDRKGKVVNGIFVKEEDLNNKEIEKAHKAYTKAINDWRGLRNGE